MMLSIHRSGPATGEFAAANEELYEMQACYEERALASEIYGMVGGFDIGIHLTGDNWERW